MGIIQSKFGSSIPRVLEDVCSCIYYKPYERLSTQYKRLDDYDIYIYLINKIALSHWNILQLQYKNITSMMTWILLYVVPLKYNFYVKYNIQSLYVIISLLKFNLVRSIFVETKFMVFTQKVMVWNGLHFMILMTVMCKINQWLLELMNI